METVIPSTIPTQPRSLQYIDLADDASHLSLAPPPITTRSKSLPSGLEHESNLPVANPGMILVLSSISD